MSGTTDPTNPADPPPPTGDPTFRLVPSRPPRPSKHWFDDLKTGCAGAFFAGLVLLCVVVGPAVAFVEHLQASAAVPLVMAGAAAVALAVGGLAAFGSARGRRDRDR